MNSCLYCSQDLRWSRNSWFHPKCQEEYFAKAVAAVRNGKDTIIVHDIKGLRRLKIDSESLLPVIGENKKSNGGDKNARTK